MTDESRSALDIVTAFGAAWTSKDLDATLAHCTPDFVFESTDPAPDGVRHIGHEAARQAWKSIFEDPASKFTVEDTIAVDDRVVQLWRFDWGTGHVRGVDVFRVRDGQVAEKYAYVKG